MNNKMKRSDNMDQVKIGKLIAQLRKNKGLTQRELGEMVGVGFRAVSKWENGLTCPDISIINELSEILGISADELLKGEVSKSLHTEQPEQKKKLNLKNLFYIIPIFLVIALSITLVIVDKNKTEVYKLIPLDSKEYYIEGETIFNGSKVLLNINKLGFTNIKFYSIIIKNYQYELFLNDTLLVGEGFIPASNMLTSKISIQEYVKDFKLNYEKSDKINIINKTNLIKNGLKLKFTFITEDNKEIQKEIKIILSK